MSSQPADSKPILRATLESSTGALFGVASRARDSIREDREQAFVSIVFSLIALEGAMNDLMSHCSLPAVVKNSPLLAKLAETLSELDRRHARVMKRAEKIYELLCPGGLDTKVEPWLGLNCLAKIRNEIVHRRPVRGELSGNSLATMRILPPESDFASYMISIQLIGEKEAEDPWHFYVGKYNVAVWAVDTCIDCFERLLLILPPGQPRSVLYREFVDTVKGLRSERRY